MRKFISIFLIIGLHLFCGGVQAQAKKDSISANAKKDSIPPLNAKKDSNSTGTKKDSISSRAKKMADTTSLKKPVKKFDPHIATRRSAMVPGWGQIYNKKYWKLPLVYGALGITAGIFIYNIKTYRLLRKAYILRVDTITYIFPNVNDLIDPRFRTLSTEAIRTNRDLFRQNVDYSVLFFLIFWGLNVVDATVDGHLKQFDVDDNLTLRIKPGFSPMANTNGISLVLDIHSKKIKPAK